MRSFILSTESTSDLPQEFLDKYDIVCYDMAGRIGDIEFGGASKNKIDIKQFFDGMRAGQKTGTSQVNLSEAEDFLQGLLLQGKDVLHIAFSSGLSGTYNNFLTAAQNLNKKNKNKVYVVDSLGASLGEGLLVYLVNKKSQTGISAKQAAEYAESIRDDVCHYFVVDDLDYLHRGGRVKKSTAVIGNILKIKPVLHVDLAGHLIPLKKVMSRRKSLNALVDYMVSKYKGVSQDVFISHGDCIDDANYVADLVEKKLGIEKSKIVINQLGPVIGSHSGPGTVALFFLGNGKKEG